jgi:alpha-L-fucosidase
MAGIVPAILAARYGHATSLFENLSSGERMLKGPFQASWESLKQYQVPGWFQDAKFGIWAHWGPQCQPEHGDWYARGMYEEGSDHYKYHVQKYGHPSRFGFKDVINEWKAENWDPAQLLSLYKKAGAQYFVALANHHDNFDNYNSKYHRWNSLNMGPKKDLIDGWAKAARNQGLYFGVSVHAAHAWTWYEPAQLADKNGALAGVPYDGKITKADGKGAWWNGYNPQELYVQNHPLSENAKDSSSIDKQWKWGAGANVPDKDYCEKFFNRTVDLINRYEPDLVYFDDTVLPLWPVSDAGLRIAAHLYNSSIKKHGKLQAVLNGKILDEEQRKCMVWDIERGQSDRIEPFVWQTDTCIGSWHYDRRIYDQKRYKSARTIIHTLADVVSKNGNLLLSVPLRGDGTIDAEELLVVEGIATWMQQNSEAIFGTRPWKIFGEGPAIESTAPLSGPGFNEGKGKPFGPEDIRFTTKAGDLYAIVLGAPADGKIRIKSLAANSTYCPSEITKAELLGHGPVNIERGHDALTVQLPDHLPNQDALCLKILQA